MKQFVCLMLACWLTVISFGQISSLSITTDKTSSLIFPFPIRHVDMGSKHILVEQIAESDKILLVKAAIRNFSESNLSVVTSDGNVYTFIVNYTSAPSHLIYRLLPQSGTTLAAYAEGILDNNRSIHGIRDRKWGITVFVKGIYIKNETIFYQLAIENNSSIDYDVDFVRFYIRDKKKGKRTSVQETEIQPLQWVGHTSKVSEGRINLMVVAFPKFTIPDAKYFAIELMEKSGGRHLMMKVSNTKIIKAKVLPDYK